MPTLYYKIAIFMAPKFGEMKVPRHNTIAQAKYTAPRRAHMVFGAT